MGAAAHVYHGGQRSHSIANKLQAQGPFRRSAKICTGHASRNEGMSFDAILRSSDQCTEKRGKRKAAVMKVPRGRPRCSPMNLGAMVESTESRAAFGMTDTAPWNQGGPLSETAAATTPRKTGHLNDLASLAKYARSKLPFANQRSRATGQTSRSCNKL
ncbi:hypothetical protein MTO96_043579 [Rhipicephalus appendiculatus]